jgi:fermentation-respiration switch protein FrsA (DUF1100 family)
MKPTTLLLALVASHLVPVTVQAADAPTVATPTGADNFYQSGTVSGERVSFRTQYAMNVVGTLYRPAGLAHDGRAPAVIVGHPMGAVKEQSAQLYAQKLAEQGFVTLAIDLPFWGESDGTPRNLVAPDMYVEAFSASVDYLGTRDFIDRDRIGVLGICGSGGFSIAAAKLDTRLRAVATVSMYDMGAVTRNGLKGALSRTQRHALLEKAAEQRYSEFISGKGIFMDYLPVTLADDADPVTREFWPFYRTARGAAVPKGYTLEQTQNRMLTSEVRFMNFYPFNDIDTISPRPMLFITGSDAHSREFSEAAYRLAGQPKELYVVPDAGHVDLYDRVDRIPFAKLGAFFQQHLAAR